MAKDKNDNKNKGIVLDLVISCLAILILEFMSYIIYKIIPYPKYIYVIVLIVLIPVFWGNLILSMMGKKSVGQRIVKWQKKNKKNNNKK